MDALSGYSGLIDNASATASAEKAKSEITKAVSSAAGSSGSSSEDSKVSSDKLMGACKQFEAYLWEQVYKEMKKTTSFGEDGSLSSDSSSSDSGGSSDYGMNMVNMFMDKAIETVSSQSVTDGPNSLAQTLYEQLKRNYNIEE